MDLIIEKRLLLRITSLNKMNYSKQQINKSLQKEIEDLKDSIVNLERHLITKKNQLSRLEDDYKSLIKTIIFPLKIFSKSSRFPNQFLLSSM